MEIRTFPNAMRPGVGLRPRQESQRPFLPQHARHCPVLEAGSAVGFLVYPPLEQNEAFHIEYQGEGRYDLTYFQTFRGGSTEAIFSLSMQLPVGGVGMVKEQITYMNERRAISAAGAVALARAFVVPGDLGTPEGGLSLRGATNFRTPPGWDTVYCSVFNLIERPHAPVLVVRVETDWYPHETEFRYVVQPGEGIDGAPSIPIGQVFFVPRESFTLHECGDKELAEIRKTREDYFRDKADLKLTTPYGLQYSPLYSRQSASRKIVK